jgi:hypothetical protein
LLSMASTAPFVRLFAMSACYGLPPSMSKPAVEKFLARSSSCGS